MKRRFLPLTLLPILTLSGAGCSRSINESSGLREHQEQQRQRDLLELKLKCADMARRFERDIERNGGGAVPLASRFAYNAKLNTCVYRGGWLVKGGSDHFILDLATNETLAEYTIVGAETSAIRSERAIFNRRELELFGPTPDLSPER